MAVGVDSDYAEGVSAESGLHKKEGK